MKWFLCPVVLQIIITLWLSPSDSDAAYRHTDATVRPWPPVVHKYWSRGVGSVERVSPFPGCRDGWIGTDAERCDGEAGDEPGNTPDLNPWKNMCEILQQELDSEEPSTSVQQLTEWLKSASAKIAGTYRWIQIRWNVLCWTCRIGWQRVWHSFVSTLVCIESKIADSAFFYRQAKGVTELSRHSVDV